MSRYILELKSYAIGPDFVPPQPHIANHLYWAVKDTQTGTYLDGYTFHGGAVAQP